MVRRARGWGGLGSHLRKHGMEDLGGSFLGLEPDGVPILLLTQHSQCHCITDEQAQKILLRAKIKAQSVFEWYQGSETLG